MPLDDVLWAARRTVEQHAEPPDDHRATGSCTQCGPDGCVLLGWAQDVLAGRRVPYPTGLAVTVLG